MSDPSVDIVWLTLAVFGILIALTVVGEIARARQGGTDNPVLETYMTRISSWWVMVTLLALALLLGKIALLLLFAFASFAALREFLTLTEKNRADHIALALAFFVVLPVQYIFIGLDWDRLYAVFIPVYAFLALPILSALRGEPRRYLIRVAETQWGLMIAVFCVSHVPALLNLDIAGYGGRGILLVAFLILVVQFGDLLDFFFGRRIGRTRIAPGLSPKTWEGMACGVGSAAVIGGLLAWITPYGVAGAMLMAAVASAFGMLGNVVFAAIKRDRGVKDWSHLIPGQGGFVDQLDSVVFAAPIFYHLTSLIWATV